MQRRHSHLFNVPVLNHWEINLNNEDCLDFNAVDKKNRSGFDSFSIRKEGEKTCCSLLVSGKDKFDAINNNISSDLAESYGFIQSVKLASSIKTMQALTYY